MSAHFDSIKTYAYIKGMAMGLHWNNTLQALSFARKAHNGQYRKSGEPYIVHPLTCASHAIALGLHDDQIIAACLLHDVIEDCHVKTEDLPVDEATRHAVSLLSKLPVPVSQKNSYEEKYYAAIQDDKIASIVKLIDRCNNVSTMSGVFTPEKVREYIDETNRLVMPLLRTAKDKWPEYSDPLFILKYHIAAVTDGLAAAMTAYSNTSSESV